MGLRVHIDDSRGFPIVMFDGEMDISQENYVDQCLSHIEKPYLVVLDFSRVSYFDASAFHWLCSWKRRHNGVLMMVIASTAVRRIISLSEIREVLAMFGSLEEAINNLRELKQALQNL